MAKAKAKAAKRAKTRVDLDADHKTKHEAKRVKHQAKQAQKDSISGKKFSELDAAEKDTLMQLLGERFGLIEEE